MHSTGCRQQGQQQQQHHHHHQDQKQSGTAPANKPSPRGTTADATRRAKRRKITLACDQCRARRTRCDGSKPVCGVCAQKGNQPDPCRYRSRHYQDDGHDQYVSSLLARIQELESSGHDGPERGERQGPARGSSQAGTGTTPRFQGPAAASTIQSASEHDDVALSDVINHMRRSGDTPLSVEERPSSVDAMGADSVIEPPNEEAYNRFYGSSSSVCFVQQVYRALGSGESAAKEPSLHPASRLGAHELQWGSLWTSHNLEDTSLLPRPIMDRILAHYWDHVYHLYPFIYKPAFTQAYEKLWAPESHGAELAYPEAGLGGSRLYGPQSIVFHCALNSMLALATQFMDLQLEDRQRLAALFAQKSRRLCRLDLFDDGSLAVIQTVLLMTQYLQCTPFPSRCWNSIGISCRLAQGLGLHLEPTQLQQKASKLELQMRRRVWYGCVMLDAVVSMTLGRPLMLHNYSHIPLPSAVDDEYLIDTETQPEERVSWLHFYTQSIKLYQILGDVVSQIYTPSTSSRPTTDPASKPEQLVELGTIDLILRVDSAISEFRHQIPKHLDWDDRDALPTHTRDNPIFTRQSAVLHARYLHLRILLYRPVFTRFCQDLYAHATTTESRRTARSSEPREIPSVIAESISLSCVRNSMQLIEEVRKRSLTAATGAWWYNVFYARTAGIVVLLAMASESLVSQLGWNALAAAWDDCRDVLSSLRKFGPRIDKALQGLDNLYQRVLSYRSARRDGRRFSSGEPATAASLDTTGSQYQPADFGQSFFSTDDEQIFGQEDPLGWPLDREQSMFGDIFSFNFMP